LGSVFPLIFTVFTTGDLFSSPELPGLYQGGGCRQRGVGGWRMSGGCRPVGGGGHARVFISWL